MYKVTLGYSPLTVEVPSPVFWRKQEGGKLVAKRHDKVYSPLMEQNCP